MEEDNKTGSADEDRKNLSLILDDSQSGIEGYSSLDAPSDNPLKSLRAPSPADTVSVSSMNHFDNMSATSTVPSYAPSGAPSHAPSEAPSFAPEGDDFNIGDDISCAPLDDETEPPGKELLSAKMPKSIIPGESSMAKTASQETVEEGGTGSEEPSSGIFAKKEKDENKEGSRSIPKMENHSKETVGEKVEEVKGKEEEEFISISVGQKQASIGNSKNETDNKCDPPDAMVGQSSTRGETVNLTDETSQDVYEGFKKYVKGEDVITDSHRATHDSDGKYKFNFIELFAGIGGFRSGLEAIGGRCVWACEKDRAARLTYRANFVQNPYYDIKAADLSTILPFDVLTAGFPCQDFSSLSDQKGVQGKKGALFWEVIRVLKECKPPALFLENVKGLVTMRKGKTMESILNALQECGYFCTYKLMNSNSLVPQVRNRVYIVGFRDRATFKRFRFPHTPCISPSPAVGDVLQSNDEDKFLEIFQLSRSQWKTVRESRGTIKYGLRKRLLMLNDTKECADTLLRNYRVSWRNMAQFVVDENYDFNEEMPGRARWFTPRECARLMGFPDGFKIHPDRWESYKQLGNAVVPGFVTLIGSLIVGAMEGGSIENGRLEKHYIRGARRALELVRNSRHPGRVEQFLARNLSLLELDTQPHKEGKGDVNGSQEKLRHPGSHLPIQNSKSRRHLFKGTIGAFVEDDSCKTKRADGVSPEDLSSSSKSSSWTFLPSMGGSSFPFSIGFLAGCIVSVSLLIWRTRSGGGSKFEFQDKFW